MTTPLNDINLLRAQLFQTQLDSAAMRQALRWMLNVVDLDAMNAKHPGSYERMMTALYAPEAPSDYIAKSAVRPVVEALEHYAECSDGCTCGDGWSHDVAQCALATARALGLLEEGR